MSEEKRTDEDKQKEVDDSMGPEFFLDQASPAESPRDKKQRTDADQRSSSPQPSPRSNLFVPASPPRFVSFEEIMRAANGVSNMALAHEITVNNEFRFQKEEPPEGSMEKKVKEIMHKAFWDSLREKLAEDPPDYSHALVLLQEVKENLVDILLPHHERFKATIEEVLDLGLIEQQADAGALNFLHYAEFVIGIMAKLCAPARDEEVAKLREITDIVPLFQEIFRVLDMMKMDMANFTIQQIRPYLQQQSVTYERTKFQQLLKTQEENGTDGLLYTRDWLKRNALKLRDTPEQPQASSSTSPGLTPNKILNSAYLQVLDWDSNYVYPETLLMDEARFRDLHQKTEWLIFVSSVLLVTYNTVGAAIAGINTLKAELKQHIADLIKDVPFRNFNEHTVNVSAQVIKDVQKSLAERGFPALPTDRETLLKGQIEGITAQDHPVHKLIKSRLNTFLQGFISRSNHNQPVQMPVGFSAVSEELSHVCGQFTRLISHNRAVFGVFYADIIGALLRELQESEGTPL